MGRSIAAYHRNGIVVALAVSAMLSSGAGPQVAELSERSKAVPPRGLYSLSQGTTPVSARVWSDPVLSGVSLRAKWHEIAPRPDQRNWSFDEEIARARKAGKTVMLRVVPGSHTPEWIYKAGAERFPFTVTNKARKTAGQARVIPVPWDAVFLREWTSFIQSMGKRYATNPTVVLVHMVGPARSSGEMHLPKSKADKSRWKRIGYSSDKLADAWKRVIDTYAAAFPNTHLSLNVSVPIYPDGTVEAVIAYARKRVGKRLCIQHNALSAKLKPDWITHRLVAERRHDGVVGFQLLCPVTPRGRFNQDGKRFGGGLAAGLAHARTAGASYVEIYPVDLHHEATRKDLLGFTRRLGSLPTAK